MIWIEFASNSFLLFVASIILVILRWCTSLLMTSLLTFWLVQSAKDKSANSWCEQCSSLLTSTVVHKIRFLLIYQSFLFPSAACNTHIHTHTFSLSLLYNHFLLPLPPLSLSHTPPRSVESHLLATKTVDWLHSHEHLLRLSSCCVHVSVRVHD